MSFDLEKVANDISNKVMHRALLDIARDIGANMPAHGERADARKMMASAAVMECLGKDFLTRTVAALMNERGENAECVRVFIADAMEQVEEAARGLLHRIDTGEVTP